MRSSGATAGSGVEGSLLSPRLLHCTPANPDRWAPLDKFEGVVKRHSTSAVRQHRLLASFVEDESHWRSRSYHLPVKPLVLLSSFHQPSIRPRRVPMIFLCEPPDTTGGESAQSIQRSNRPQSIDPGAPAGCSR